MDARPPTRFVLATLILAACQSVPYGEVLLIADTDLPVPRLASHLRVDLYDTEGTWYLTRDVPALRPSDWPVSFGIATHDAAGKRVRVRLRAYPEGSVRDYRGEHYPAWPAFAEPRFATSLAELCANPPLLAPYQTITLRRGPDPVTAPIPQADCTVPNVSGSVAVRIHVSEAADYRFEVVRAVPDGESGFAAGDTTLFLRSTCADASSQLGCNHHYALAQQNFLSRLLVTLPPGDYFLLTGSNAASSPADLTLRWGRADSWSTLGDAPDAGAPLTSDEPRLVVDGEDQTPASEPSPGVTVDRLFDVDVRYGERQTARLFLPGECAGTAPDLGGGRSCVDTAGQLAAVTPTPLTSGFEAAGASRQGAFADAVSRPCAATPRPPSPLFDEEVCVPGGVFILGSHDVIGLAQRSAVPEQLAIIDPLLVDRYEMTVGRYRAALRAGFQSPDHFSPVANNAPLYAGGPNTGCTFNGDAIAPAPGIDREDLPLTCVSFYAARALCRFLGADLPTHAEWEYIAVARPDGQVRFPSGDATPGCADALIARDPGQACYDRVRGPRAVDAAPFAMHDRSAAGVVGLEGNVAEWALDSLRGYDDACWWQRTLRGVGCQEENATLRSVRGSAFSGGPIAAASLTGLPPIFAGFSEGLRCVRPGAPP